MGGDRWCDEAQRALVDAGYRVGSARLAVVGLLADSEHGLTAYDVVAQL